MNNAKDIAIFYAGAVMFFDIEAEEVDELLAKHNLNADEDDLQICAAVVKNDNHHV